MELPFPAPRAVVDTSHPANARLSVVSTEEDPGALPEADSDASIPITTSTTGHAVATEEAVGSQDTARQGEPTPVRHGPDDTLPANGQLTENQRPLTAKATAEVVLSKEPRLYADAQLTEADHLHVHGGDISLYSRRCSDKSSPNEDSAVVIPIADRGVVLAVADGVGGMPQGEEASRVTLQTLVEFIRGAADPGRLRIAILDAIEKANRRVLALGGGAGTTLAVAQVIDQRIRTYHVGDSEIFVIGGRGAIKLQTVAHGPVAYGVHCGLIDPAEALAHEHRNVVSNVVGAHDMRIELGPQLKLAPRDLVLLCSDGITDNMHAEEIALAIRGKSPQDAAAAILRSLQSRREQNGVGGFKEDDSTFALYRCAQQRTRERKSKRQRISPAPTGAGAS